MLGSKSRKTHHVREVQMRYLKTGVLAAGAMASLGLAFAAPGRIARGQVAPDFAGTSLDGRKVTLSEFRGRNPVVLNFYADFCSPCRKEFPHLKELDETLGAKGLRIVSVSMDEGRDTASGIPTQYHVRFPVLFDPKGTIAQKYGVQAIPHTVVIDREGRVHTVIIGMDLDKLDHAVDQVIR